MQCRKMYWGEPVFSVIIALDFWAVQIKKGIITESMIMPFSVQSAGLEPARAQCSLDP